LYPVWAEGLRISWQDMAPAERLIKRGGRFREKRGGSSGTGDDSTGSAQALALTQGMSGDRHGQERRDFKRLEMGGDAEGGKKNSSGRFERRR